MIARPPAIGKGALVGVRLQPNPCPNRRMGRGARPLRCDPPTGRAGAQGEIEFTDSNRRQTDTGVLMLLKTKLLAEYAARRLRLLGELGRITPAFPVGRVRRQLADISKSRSQPRGGRDWAKSGRPNSRCRLPEFRADHFCPAAP